MSPLPAWDGKLHYEGEPDRFARTRALFQKEDEMHAVHEVVAPYVSKANVLWFAGSLFVAAFSWWLLCAGSVEESPLARHRAETIDLLARRSEKIRQEPR